MAEAEKVQVGEEKQPVQTVLIPCEQKEKPVVICDMCGHANPDKAAMCEMCSNYLI